ncbi:23S rRNA (uracil(1939)-C(5))-methyltransferase RlmD [Acutalibacter caecimuris]|uniref:23S rRNA (uracil(1939)-C(5))-methyltransferase RlmD n=1 Tax=Acutalibacter caecimuris TaxID=3093657 RepID=UPI002AC9E9CF|nr:23S rRNA (uracil(1939)-C(5))-methyltransferase RlmD [Acutalibacter sp. M00118]
MSVDLARQPLRKNQIIQLKCTGFTAEGAAVGRYQGEAVFVPRCAPGDQAQVKIVKAAKTHAFGRLERLLAPAPCRVEPDCPVYAQCGGCCFRHISYPAELEAKTQRVRDALERVGGFTGLPVAPILPADSREGYRNKALLPIGRGPHGEVQLGFYARNSHRIVPCASCRLHPQAFTLAAGAFCRWAEAYGDPVYDESAHSGCMRRLYLRKAEATGQVMVCVVVKGQGLTHEKELVEALRAGVPGLAGVIINTHNERTNVALGPHCRTVWGQGSIRDRLCGLEFEISPLSFYQVNRTQAERLYGLAAAYAQLDGGLLLDLYCGTGTIGLSMAKDAGQLIGVEVVPEAVEDARRNARRNHITNAEFLCADAAQAGDELARRGLRPAVITLDPPRKGCAPGLVEAVVRMAPQRIVYISCDPATLARDLKLFAQLGYPPIKAAPVDMFPGTAHVETVCLLSKLPAGQHI